MRVCVCVCVCVCVLLCQHAHVHSCGLTIWEGGIDKGDVRAVGVVADILSEHHLPALYLQSALQTSLSNQLAVLLPLTLQTGGRGSEGLMEGGDWVGGAYLDHTDVT